jgi:hypothetical protein
VSDLNLKRMTLLGYFIGGLAYLFVIVKEQIFSDEYDLLGSGEDLSNHIMKDGRPIGAIIYRGMAHFVNSPSDIVYLRILSLIASLLLLWFITNEISKVFESDFLKLLISSAIFLPTFVLYITWGMLSYFMLSSLISFVAFKLWATCELKSRFIALILQVMVLLVYPPSAFASFAFIGVIALISNSPLTIEAKKVWNWIVLNFCAGVLSIVIVYLDSNLRGYSLNSRVQFVNLGDVLDKLAWLFSRPLIISSRFFDIRSPNTVTATLTFLFFSAILFYGFNRYHINTRMLLGRSILYVACLLLSLAPIMLSVDNQFDYRLILGTSISLYIAFVFSILQILRRFSESIFPIILTLIVLLLVGVVTMYSHSTKLFVDPYILKQQLIYDSIDDCFLNNSRPARIVLEGREKKYASRNNLGLFSMRTDMASDWVPIPSFKLALKEKSLPEISVVWAGSGTVTSPRDCRIDLSKFVTAFSN